MATVPSCLVSGGMESLQLIPCSSLTKDQQILFPTPGLRSLQRRSSSYLCMAHILVATILLQAVRCRSLLCESGFACSRVTQNTWHQQQHGNGSQTMAGPLVWWCIPGVRRSVSGGPGGLRSGLATYWTLRPAAEFPTPCASGHVLRIPSPPCPTARQCGRWPLPEPLLHPPGARQGGGPSYLRVPACDSGVSSWRSEMTGSIVHLVVAHHHNVPAAVRQHQVVQGLGEVLERGRYLVWRAVHGAQQEGRAVSQHYTEDHHLHLRQHVHVKMLGLHSLLKAYSHSAPCSFMAVPPGPVGVATYFAKRGIHLAVKPGPQLCRITQSWIRSPMFVQRPRALAEKIFSWWRGRCGCTMMEGREEWRLGVLGGKN